MTMLPYTSPAGGAARAAGCTQPAGALRAVLPRLGLLVLLCLLPLAAGAADGRPGFDRQEVELLLDELQANGLSRGSVAPLLRDDRLRKVERVITFNAMNPDSAGLYEQFTGAFARRLARRFHRRHEAELERVAERYGVPEEIIVAILLIETQFGNARLPYRVLEVFATLAVEAHPEAVERHFERLKPRYPNIERDWLAARLEKKARFGLRELTAFLRLHEQGTIGANGSGSLYDVHGSYAGAIGMPQFLPSSVLRWAVDGNGDGSIDLDQRRDATASIANFLVSHGWKNGNFTKQWLAVWEYNHSRHYVRTVFEAAFQLKAPSAKQPARYLAGEQKPRAPTPPTLPQ